MLAIAHSGARLNKAEEAPQNCTIPLNVQGLIRGEIGPYTVQLVDVQLDWSWYPINTENNVMHVESSNHGELNVTLPVGVYTTGADIATAIQTALINAMSGGTPISWTVTFSDLTKKLTLTPSAGSCIFYQDSSAHSVLGLKVDVILTASTPFTMPYVIDLNHNDVALIDVDWPDVKSAVYWGGDASDVNRVSTRRPIMGICQVGETWGHKCNFMSNPVNFTSTIIPIQIKVSIRDTHGRFLDLNGIDYTLTFALYDLPGISNSGNHVIVDSRNLFTNLSNEAPSAILASGPTPDGYGREARNRNNKRPRLDTFDARPSADPGLGTGFEPSFAGRRPVLPP